MLLARILLIATMNKYVIGNDIFHSNVNATIWGCNCCLPQLMAKVTQFRFVTFINNATNKYKPSGPIKVEPPPYSKRVVCHMEGNMHRGMHP